MTAAAAAMIDEEIAVGQSEEIPKRGLLSVGTITSGYRQIDGVARSSPQRVGARVAISVALLLAAFLVVRPHVSAKSRAPASTQLWGGEEETPGEKEREKPPPYSPLLFCFAVVRVSGYEPELMNAQHDHQAGLFVCDAHEIYSTGGTVEIGSVRTTEVIAPESSMGDFGEQGTTTDSWLNTATFIKAWDMVLEDDTWWTNDWTVKVDPDAVFFPNRLRLKVAPHTGGLNAKPLWVGNCDRVWHSAKPRLKLFGSLEVFSRNAIGMYHEFGEKCKRELPWHGWGEDMFMQMCMEKLKVKAINGTDFLGDKRCHDAPCTDVHKVAFHDFKSVESFFQCREQSLAMQSQAGEADIFFKK